MGLTIGLDARLVRRFNDQDPSHVSNVLTDEGAGIVRRLRGRALRFDDDGCSVYRVAVIEELGLAVESIAIGSYTALAYSTRGLIEEFRSGHAAETEPEFAVYADPVPPGEPHDPAHASIRSEASYPSNTKRRAAIDALAGAAFTI